MYYSISTGWNDKALPETLWLLVGFSFSCWLWSLLWNNHSDFNGLQIASVTASALHTSFSVCVCVCEMSAIHSGRRQRYEKKKPVFTDSFRFQEKWQPAKRCCSEIIYSIKLHGTVKGSTIMNVKPIVVLAVTQITETSPSKGFNILSLSLSLSLSLCLSWEMVQQCKIW